jgi:NAD(P)H dehydrogenase (quinone)
LLSRGVPAERIVAVGRAVERLSDLAERGVQVPCRPRRSGEPAPAFAGAERVLISGSDPVPALRAEAPA